MKPMNCREIETSREIRLWITGILGPVILGGASIIANNPEVQTAIVEKTKEVLGKIKSKLIRK